MQRAALGKIVDFGLLLNRGPSRAYLKDFWGLVALVTTLPTGKTSGGSVEVGRSGM